MATAEQYADWIVRNQDKKGSKEFETVAAAYKLAKQTEAPAPAAAAAPTEIPAARRGPSLADIGDRATGFRAQVEATGMTPEERVQAVRTGALFAGGLGLGPIAAGIVRGAAALAPAITRFAQPVATALETGGFRTGLGRETPAAARFALRTGAGAATGGGAAALVSPEDAATGAVVGGALPTVLPPVARIVAKGGGAVVDALAGRTADARANELIRTAANNEINALRQAMAANPDVPASRAAADLDLPVLQALLQRAEQRDPRQVVNAFRARESQDVLNELTRLAGGPTAETARAAREGARASLAGVTGPMREEALAAARRTGEVVPKLETIATEARKDVSEAVDRVRRFTGAIDSADEWAKTWVASGGARAAAPRPPARFTFPGELAVTAERRAGEAAEESLRAGGRARAAEATLESMRARGIEPLRSEQLTTRLSGLLRNPEIATNREASAAIPRVVDMINDWTNQNGIVTPEALYAIRKNAVAGVIRELNPTMDAKAQERFAAKVLTQIKPMIDTAIERAGGKGFSDYLRSVESGMSSIKGMELADQIRKLYGQGTAASKQQIIDLVRGESPEAIEELFGSGRYQISKEMAKDMPLLRRIADTLDLDLKAVKQAAAGRAALTEAEKKTSARIRFPFFTRASTAVNEVVAGLEQRMKGETLDVLIRAAQSGREFNRVLDQIPAKERSAFLSQFKNAESWNKFAGQVAQAAQAQVVAEPDVTVTKIGNRLIEQPNSNALRP
jgi:hypothetical protein